MKFYYNSPIGNIIISTSKNGITSLGLSPKKYVQNNNKNKDLPIVSKTIKELDEYFQNKRTHFTLPLDIKGTDFQKSAWKVLQKIPYGESISYKKQAELLGNSNKSRACGQANKNNPLPILIPCHRVISSDKSIGGFLLGVKVKKYLLELEGNLLK